MKYYGHKQNGLYRPFFEVKYQSDLEMDAQTGRVKSCEVFALGDSHTFIMNWLEGCAGYKIRSGLAASFDYSRVGTVFHECEDAIKTIRSHSKAPILISFGEIDIRVHALRQIYFRKISSEKLLDEIVKRYSQSVSILNDNYGEVSIMEVPSVAGAGPVSQNVMQIGNTGQLCILTRQINQKLLEECKRRRLKFLSTQCNTEEFYDRETGHLGVNSVEKMAEALSSFTGSKIRSLLKYPEMLLRDDFKRHGFFWVHFGGGATKRTRIVTPSLVENTIGLSIDEDMPIGPNLSIDISLQNQFIPIDTVRFAILPCEPTESIQMHLAFFTRGNSFSDLQKNTVRSGKLMGAVGFKEGRQFERMEITVESKVNVRRVEILFATKT